MQAKRNPIEHHGGDPDDGFAMIANDLIRDGDIGADAFRVLALLLSHDGSSSYQESATAIAARYHWGRNRAIKALRELVASRRLVIQEHQTAKGTRAYERYHVHKSRR
jgi:hypothetical protein